MYVYYGQEADYEFIEQQGVKVEGNIVLARYGASFRANIVTRLLFKLLGSITY